ncbi:cell wall-binding repeat-containing protein [Paenibacillus agricola]|uniref:cell wall-binding repeat-containing protein n=1 Tax=Paenibacillus agricola TaxID=2716264 RepID=UPI001FB86038|nr:cell wall-binding repeat-containing protein [Paenibacillus agricola]
MKKTIKLGIASLVTAFAVTGCLNNQNNAPPQVTPDKGSAGQQTGVVATSNVPWIASKNTTRINTSDPIEAAVLVSKTLWMATSDENRPGGVILADPNNWQTTLVSADLIHHPNNGPILFANKDGIPEATLNELKRLKPKGVDMNNGVQVIIVGDFDQKVEDQVKEVGLKLDKITGGNAAAIAKQVDAYYTKVAQENPPSVIVGSMDSQEFTMPALNWIAHMPEPLLYVKKDEVPQETADALKTRGGKANIYIIGPETVVSASTEQQLGQFGRVVRIAGNDAYENAIAFAKYKDLATDFGWGITTPGHNFSFVNKNSPALALAAAPFSHLGKHAPLLWTDKDKMPDSVMAYLMSVEPKYKKAPTEGPYNHAWLTGSEDVLTAVEQGEIDSMLEIVSESGEGHGAHGTGNTQTETPPKPAEGTGDNMPNMPGMKH